MRFHLFWLEKNWKKRGDCANNYNLIVDMENKTYKVYTNAFMDIIIQKILRLKRNQILKIT